MEAVEPWEPQLLELLLSRVGKPMTLVSTKTCQTVDFVASETRTAEVPKIIANISASTIWRNALGKREKQTSKGQPMENTNQKPVPFRPFFDLWQEL